MKTLIKRSTLIVWLIMMSILSCQAQERIRLTSGRTIKDARLYKEHERHITYERRNSIHDLPKAQLEYIETDTSYFQLNDRNELVEMPKLETINERSPSPKSSLQLEDQATDGYSQLMQSSKMGFENVEDESDEAVPEDVEEPVVQNEPFDDSGVQLPPPSSLLKYGAIAVAYSTVAVLLIALAL